MKRLRAAGARPLVRPESIIFGFAILLLGVAVYGEHVLHGGFTADDWAYASDAKQYPGVGGLFRFADRLFTGDGVLMSAGTRPVAALYFSVTYRVFDAHMQLHLAWVVILAILMSTLLYVVFCRFGLARLHAGFIALLVLVFPAADSVRFWPTAAQSEVAISLYLIGLLLARRGLRAQGNSAIAFHAEAGTCYVLSLLTYEVAAAAIFFSFVLYRINHSWKSALRRLPADWVLLGSVVLYLKIEKTALAQPATPLRDMLNRGRDIQGEARSLLTSAGIQGGPTRLPIIVLALLLVLASVVAVATRDPVLRTWLSLTAAGAIIVGIGYVPYLPTESFYSPLRPGIGNRTNIGAAAGYVLIFYSILLLMGQLLTHAATTIHASGKVKSAIAVVVPIAGSFLLGAAWIRHIEQDRRAWDRAYALDRTTLSVLRSVPAPRHGTTVYTFGQPGTTAPLVPTFFSWWDLTGAVRLAWDDPSAFGVPVVRDDGRGTAQVTLTCESHAVVPHGFLYRSKGVSAYGHALFVDVRAGTFRLITNQATCQRALKPLLKLRT